jgi:LmbE family N-acetylglucosaminyl deacetylase
VEARHPFIETIRRTKPNIIITHPTQDYHPDHRATSQLVMDAAQIARTQNYDSDYPPHREIMPVAFMDGEMGINFLPEDYVDISDVFETKIQMLMQHRSQLMPDHYDPDFVVPPNDQNPFYRMAETMSGFRGLACGARYAEGFRWWRSANRIVTRRVLP